jgi:hypothetical protein
VADHPLSPRGDTLVVLDACVLLPPRLSDVLFDLALEGLYVPLWTAEIEAEFLRNFQAATGAASADGGARRLRAFLKDPPYTAAELLGALALHGAVATGSHP